MSVTFTYFAAPDDEAAAATIDWPGGPARAPTEERSPRHVSAETDSAVASNGFPSVEGGFDPVMQAGTLTAILAERDYDEISGEPGWGRLIAARDGGEGLVLALPPAVGDLLADRSAARLEQAAVAWAETEEFWGQADPGSLGGMLGELRELARTARSTGSQLYCWICV
ncbi:hypothetical protein [Agromyces mariniharenae]|uniref:DUF1877 domain-containing protein n=1 Tax=Agromyces mariniharenae TaxID=2604423 RepID=A0A5S4UY12_9MICO|nr:hypothetical protein [Agromyces mariniharenae]TYL50503.1 hypothetical protein FYC51_14995 [Agromyces mariniharenae]